MVKDCPDTGPVDRAHAHSMWQQMSDSTHQVWTAVRAVKVQLTCDDKGVELWQITAERQMMESTDVSFIPLTQAMMDSYWDSGEPADKAGGYGIQGHAAKFVVRIEGSYLAVVGLPLYETEQLIQAVESKAK